MIAKYLEELLKQKEQLVTNLRIKGVEADSSETLNTLIPKILQIQDSSPKRQPVFVAEEVPEKYADTIYTIFQNGIQRLLLVYVTQFPLGSIIFVGLAGQIIRTLL